jgi:hypothetical protein
MRKLISAWANGFRHSPGLSENATQDHLLIWLAWCDPNGEWAAHRARLRHGNQIDEDGDSPEYELDIPTVDELWGYIEEMYNDDCGATS